MGTQAVCQPKHSRRRLGRTQELGASEDRHAPALAFKHGGHISPAPTGSRYSSSSSDTAEAALAAAGSFGQCQGSAGKVCSAAAVENYLTYRQPSASVSLKLSFVFKT